MNSSELISSNVTADTMKFDELFNFVKNMDNYSINEGKQSR